MSHCFIRKKFQLPPFSFSWPFNIWYICTFFCLQTQNQKSNKSICKQFAIPVLLVHRRAINVTSTMSFSIAVWKLLKPGDQLRFTLDGPIHPKFCPSKHDADYSDKHNQISLWSKKEGYSLGRQEASRDQAAENTCHNSEIHEGKKLLALMVLENSDLVINEKFQHIIIPKKSGVCLQNVGINM